MIIKPLHKAVAAMGLVCAMMATAGAVAVNSTPVATTATITEATSSTAAYGHHHGGSHHGCYTQRRNSCHTWTTDCNGNRYCTTHAGYCSYCPYS